MSPVVNAGDAIARVRPHGVGVPGSETAKEPSRVIAGAPQYGDKPAFHPTDISRIVDEDIGALLNAEDPNARVELYPVAPLAGNTRRVSL